MLIAIVNQSSKVTDEELLEMTTAIATQIRNDAAPAWDRPPAAIVSYGTIETKAELRRKVPKEAHGITLVDDIPDQPKGVLGYHTEDQGGKIWGVVAASPSLDNGAKAATGDWSVSSILSHEVLEMFVDPNCNLWASDGHKKMYSVEVCDPVEAPTYDVDGVSVSNFVLPAWFDPLAAKNGKTAFDKCRLLKKPFTRLDAGYIVYASAGAEHQQGGDRLPAWRRASKASPFARTRRREQAVAGPA
jgi:hypothetical protein